MTEQATVVSRQTTNVDLTHYLSRTQIRTLVEHALDEDLGRGDATSDVVVPADSQGTAVLRVRTAGTIAGTDVAALVFHTVDPSLDVTIHLADGTTVAVGDDVATIRGSARSILRGERVALNFIQRLSG